MHFCWRVTIRWLTCVKESVTYPEQLANSLISQRSKLVQAGNMISAKRGLALKPDRLVDHKWQAVGSVGLNVAVGFGHGADKGAAVPIVHLYFRKTVFGIFVRFELCFDGAPAKAFAPPLWPFRQECILES